MKLEGVLFPQEPLLRHSVVAAGIGLDTFVDDGVVGVVVGVVAVDPFAVGYTLLDVLEILKICDVRMRLCVLGLERHCTENTVRPNCLLSLSWTWP